MNIRQARVEVNVAPAHLSVLRLGEFLFPMPLWCLNAWQIAAETQVVSNLSRHKAPLRHGSLSLSHSLSLSLFLSLSLSLSRSLSLSLSLS